jgi:MoxR-like ATPase
MQRAYGAPEAGAAGKLQKLIAQVREYFVGYEDLVQLLAVALLSEGHVLIEGPPGTGKTLLAKVFAMSIGGTFSRIQMTPDLLPSDIVGSSYYDLQSGGWKLKLGPIHANVVLIDELNRATPRTQSALLEAMQERQVSIEGRTIPLPRPFLAIATMVPVGEGIYPLPFLTMDRFSFSAQIAGPDPQVEREVLRRIDQIEQLDVKPVLSAEEVLAMAAEARRVHVSERVREYIVNLVQAVRRAEEVDAKPSTRAAVWMLKGARALAYLEGRSYVLPDDVKRVAVYALRHRVTVKPDYSLDGVTPEQVIRRALEEVEVPKA